IEGCVVLRLTIDVDGSVVEADVMEPAGHGFDEAARAAALRARYRPARRGDAAMRARILTRVEFELPEPPATGSLSGLVVLGVAGTPAAAGVEVAVTTADGVTSRTRTGVDGRFVLNALVPGVCVIVASGPGLGSAKLRAHVVAGE